MPNVESSLEDLLARYGRGDAAAFREFFARTRPVVYGYLRKRMADHQAADDVFQDAYLRVHRYVTSFDPSGNALAWLLRIAHRCLSDHLRRQYERSETGGELPDIADAQSLRAEDAVLLREVLAQADGVLGRDDVDLVVERFVAGDSFEEIAARRAWSPANARQRLSRALKKLRASGET